MAITTTTISLASGYGRTDVIQQLEQGFAYLQWHQATASGIVTGITTYSGGGDVGSASTSYFDARQESTTGIGTGASFYIDRAADGTIPGYVLVNRPGMGYTDGETVTIPASEIGGTANGASALTITVGIATTTGSPGTAVGFGSTGAFFKKDISDSATYPWAVARVGIDTSKEFGTTFYGFQMFNDTKMMYKVGSSFYPNSHTPDNVYRDRNGGYKDRFAGNYLLDMPHTPVVSNQFYDSATVSQNETYLNCSYQGETIASSNSYQLDLNIFRSSIDTNFAVMAYRHPDKSANYITDKQYQTYILHNFTTNIWDLDYVFLSGRTDILMGTVSDPKLTFRSWGVGDHYRSSNIYPSRRAAEYGYYGTNSSNYAVPYKEAVYRPTSIDSTGNQTEVGIYYRNNSNAANLMNRGRGGAFFNSEFDDTVADAANYGAVIKGIPLNTQLIPTPYYMPDDFALIQFDYASPDALIQMFDTVTVSGSEVYTVITASYNQTNRTRGIAFCARTT